MQTPTELKSKLSVPLTTQGQWLFRVEYRGDEKKRCGRCEACCAFIVDPEHAQICEAQVWQRLVCVASKYWRTAHQEAWKGDGVVRVHTIATPFDKIESADLAEKLQELWRQSKTPEGWLAHDKFMARLRTPKPNGALNGAAKPKRRKKRSKA